MSAFKALTLFAALTFAQTKEAPMSRSTVIHHAQGTFEVDVKPSPAARDGLTRMTIDKQIYGDLEATTQGEMITAGDFQSGNAGYVAMERVTGTLGGHTGTFTLQHIATMDATGPHMSVTVTPGSGTGQLVGLTGNFTIVIAGGKHSYTFDYTLPN